MSGEGDGGGGGGGKETACYSGVHRRSISSMFSNNSSLRASFLEQSYSYRTFFSSSTIKSCNVLRKMQASIEQLSRDVTS